MIVEQVDEVFFMNCICGTFLPVLDDSVLMTLKVTEICKVHHVTCREGVEGE